jgi:hypothetical protein
MEFKTRLLFRHKTGNFAATAAAAAAAAAAVDEQPLAEGLEGGRLSEVPAMPHENVGNRWKWREDFALAAAATHDLHPLIMVIDYITTNTTTTTTTTTTITTTTITTTTTTIINVFVA